MLQSARERWPDIRLPRLDIHFPNHAHFATRNQRGPFPTPATDDKEFAGQVIEWSRAFPDVTFAVVHCEEGRHFARSASGLLCRNGQETYVVHAGPDDRSYRLLDKLHVDTQDADPLAPEYFLCLRDVFAEGLENCAALREYSKFMQALLREAREQLDREWNTSREHYFEPGWEDDVEDPFDEITDFARSEDHARRWHDVVVTQELIRSVFITACAILERTLTECCKYLIRRHGPGRDQVTFDITSRAGGLDEQQKYLASLTTAPYFAGSAAWLELSECRTIRNYLIHTGPVIDLEWLNIQVPDEHTEPESKKRKRIAARRREQYEFVEMIGRQPDVVIEYGGLTVRIDACTRCLDRVESLFTELCPLLPNI